MREEVWWAVEPGPAAGGDGVAEMLGIPIDDDGGKQVETRHTVMLPLGSKPLSRDFVIRLKRNWAPKGAHWQRKISTAKRELFLTQIEHNTRASLCPTRSLF